MFSIIAINLLLMIFRLYEEVFDYLRYTIHFPTKLIQIWHLFRIDFIDFEYFFLLLINIFLAVETEQKRSVHLFLSLLQLTLIKNTEAEGNLVCIFYCNFLISSSLEFVLTFTSYNNLRRPSKFML
jgi:hypothetical protein